MTDAIKFLEALAARPKEWRVSIRYADGHVRVFDAHSEAAAENHALMERRKIDRDLISRGTGETVRVVSVTVGKNAI